MMREVYGGATRVLDWLGLGDGDSADGIRWPLLFSSRALMGFCLAVIPGLLVMCFPPRATPVEGVLSFPGTPTRLNYPRLL
jgi:hypothetical protein